MLKKIKIKDRYLSRVNDDELLDFVYAELKKNKYEEIQYSNQKITIRDEALKHIFEVWSYTHLIKTGEIRIEHSEKHRILLFDFKLNNIHLYLGFLFGLIVGLSSQSLAFGIFIFSFLGGLNWLITVWWQISDIKTTLERLRIKKLREERQTITEY